MPDAPSDHDAFSVILFRNRHVSFPEPADSLDFRLLVQTRDQLRQLGTAILEAATELETSR